MSNINFDNINYLYIFIPLFLLVCVPFFVLIRKKKMNFHNLTSLFLHVLICALLAFTASGINKTTTRHETTIFIVADVSSSTDNVIEQMDEYIDEFKSKISLNTELGVVAFAKDSDLLVPVGGDLVSLSRANVDKSATNLENALLYTNDLFELGVKKRIVVLSDGLQTDGDAIDASSLLTDYDVRIDAVYFDSTLGDESEMLIDDVSCSNSTFLNRQEQVSVSLISNYSATASFTLTNNSQVILQQDMLVNVGKSTITLPLDTSVTGTNNYQLTINEANDTNVENNVFYFQQIVNEKNKVLVISKTYEYTKSQVLKELIDSSNDVTMIDATSSIISKIDYLCTYDEVILNNIDFNEFDNAEAFAELLETYVTKYGKSVITLGGTSTYQDGSFPTRLQNMLPIDSDPSDAKDSTALMILIDNSGSMSGNRLDMAKQGAISVLDILDENDQVGIVTFGSVTRTVYPLSFLSHPVKQSMISRIKTIQSEDATMMTAGLNVALSSLSESDMASKEVIVISDGMPGDGGQQAVVRAMAEQNIITSTINIGQYAGSQFMAQLAEIGNGRHYTINDANDLPNVMLNEVTQIIMDTYVEGDLTININSRNDELLNGISTLPNLTGVNFSKAKYNASTVLSTSVTLENGSEYPSTPILAYWDYGNGRVASLMTDAMGGWSNELINSDSGRRLINNMINIYRPEEHTEDAVIFESISNGSTTSLYVTLPSIASNTRLNVTITAPSGEEQKVTMRLENGVYTEDFTTEEKGNYDVFIEYLNFRTSAYSSYNKSFAYSYSTEYQSFKEADNILLWQIINSGEILSPNIDDIVNVNQDEVIITEYYTIPFLIAIMCLFIIDVIIRKLKWKDITRLFKRKAKNQI